MFLLLLGLLFPQPPCRCPLFDWLNGNGFYPFLVAFFDGFLVVAGLTGLAELFCLFRRVRFDEVNGADNEFL